eukprot:GHRR01003195.1.p1 GENE.GHRR01003195.1~~GHRR01003195.1.p1  ORF type:complete len:247 (+),score=70.83 GHRR01003195.1:79-819(+)
MTFLLKLRIKAATCYSSVPHNNHRMVPFQSSAVRSSLPIRTSTKQVDNRDVEASCSRRDMLSFASAAVLVSYLTSIPTALAIENPLQNIARQFTRPADITPLDATVALLDARNTLRDMAELVASPLDSKERFDGRKMWPAYAKWLRQVGPSAPVAAAVINGTDAEATLSSEYGGSGGSNASVDSVYIALGKVLTISGRTIRDEAQISLDLCKAAEDAITNVLDQLPHNLLDKAQQYRVARAAGKLV